MVLSPVAEAMLAALVVCEAVTEGVLDVVETAVLYAKASMTKDGPDSHSGCPAVKTRFSSLQQ